ncbi:MAG: hypothetical protein JXQ65_09620 [Candidatus Marinimicrobia bacterium]|nr:hypothetical protein [Candidatus Neomarinimicrobiota bacterium]
MKKNLIILMLLLSVGKAFAVEEVWFRTDADATGFYLWFGAKGACPLTGWTLAHDMIYYPQTNAFEIEIGPLFSLGSLDILPMFGIWANVNSGETEYLMPQLYFYYTKNNFYFESWNIFSYGSAAPTDGEKFFYGRHFVKFSGILEWMSFGPQAEFVYDFDEQLEENLTSVALGGRISFPYGEGNSFDVFAGPDIKNDNGITMRLTFVRYFQ